MIIEKALTLPWENIGREQEAWCAPRTDTNWRRHMLSYAKKKKRSNRKRNWACSPTKLAPAPAFVPVFVCVSATVVGCKTGSRRDAGGSAGRRWWRHRRPTLPIEFRR